MKFTDGYWLNREGVRTSYATEVRDARAADGRLTLHAAVRKVERRGNTLNAPLVTVETWSPAEGVIAVRSTHHAGRRPRTPSFELTGEAGYSGEAWVADGTAGLDTGSLSLRVDTREPWRLSFRADGRELVSAGPRGTGFAVTDDGHHYAVAQLSLGVGELVYGLGERFTPFTRNGQSVDIWQADGGTASEQAYKNVPFHLTNRGYGVFVNHPGKVSYEIGSEAVGRVQFSVEDQSVEYYVIHGPTPKEILERYTALTGRPPLPPAWSFGLWLSTSFTTDYDEETVNRFVSGMAEREIPLEVFHFDCFWMREYQWCDFTWDPEVFPDPDAMLRRLRDRGLRISVWINPYIAQKSPLFAEARDRGYLLHDRAGDVWQWDMWQAGMGLVDFTNPEACTWYADHLRRLARQGVDCFKTDFGERVPTDVVWHDGSDPERMHNYYTQLYNELVFEVLREEKGRGEGVLFARSATAGGQQFPVHWGGDCESTFDAMAESLRGGLSLGLSGFGFWSHDIGGFEGTPDPAVFKRWTQFGLLSSHSRLHGSSSYRVPWNFDDEAVAVMRQFTRLKLRLMPYLYRAAVQAEQRGTPVMRAMVLEFPEDPGCHGLDRQYMLGEDLLVAPVFDAEGEVEYYLPAGEWTHLLTGERLTGPGWRRERHGFDSLPLLARPGSVVALAVAADSAAADWARGVTLRVHAPADGAEVRTEVPGVDGATVAVFRTRRTGDTVTVRAESGAGACGRWSVVLAGADGYRDPVEVADGAVEVSVPVGD